MESAALSAKGSGPILEARGIAKAFGPVTVLSGIDLTLEAGEVHAVIGENCAGKSTLMKLMAGHLMPT
jgi:ribose transport system ATP-binding protein